LDEYENNPMLRAAVERNFEVIGEALSQALKFFPQIAGRLTDEQKIIAFRNRLIHGYATVRHALVWDIGQTGLPRLQDEIAQLRRDAE